MTNTRAFLLLIFGVSSLLRADDRIDKLDPGSSEVARRRSGLHHHRPGTGRISVPPHGRGPGRVRRGFLGTARSRPRESEERVQGRALRAARLRESDLQPRRAAPRVEDRHGEVLDHPGETPRDSALRWFERSRRDPNLVLQRGPQARSASAVQPGFLQAAGHR